ncbi:MAG TPA: hypothetical protein ENK66_02525 [Arcobacter sp.]|nr:hypothetical protein [Arcobacter sp.]
MKKNSDLIKHYSVKIESNFGKQGSGVLIKVDDKKCYLATAKHNFTSNNRDDSWEDVEKVFLEQKLSDISISQNKNKICDITNILSFCDGYDVIIFEVKDIDNKLKRLSKVNVLYSDTYGKEHEYFFHGYPKKGNYDEIIEKLYIKTSNDYIYTLGTNEPFRKAGLEGFSGSGVFIMDNGRLYLVGVVIQRSDELSSFIAFNLPRYLNEQEASLLPLQKDVLDLENFDDMQDLILRRNRYNPLIQEYKNLFQGDTFQASKLPDKAKEIGYLGDKFQISNQFIEREAIFRNELADMYLLATSLSKKFGKDELVKYYFQKATEYEPRYIRYLKDIKIEYSIDELMRDAKIAFIEDRFNDAKIFFEALLHLHISDEQRIDSYEKILEIATIHFNEEEIIKTSETLLELYPEEEKLKKAIIYYKLSMMNIDECKQHQYIQKALSLVIMESTNPSFFEIQYKLKKRKNELLNLEEELLKSKDSSLNLKDHLEKLLLINKTYKSEYQQLALKEKYKDIIKTASKRIWVGIMLGLLTFILLLFVYFTISKPTYKIEKLVTINYHGKYMKYLKVINTTIRTKYNK